MDSIRHDPPWTAAATNVNRSALVLGWRCSTITQPFYDEDAAKDFIQSSTARPLRSTGGYEVYVSGYWGARAENRPQTPLIVDLWLKRPQSTPSEIRSATTALDTMRKVIGAQLKLIGEENLKIEQEFLEIRLPRLTAGYLDTNRARAAIVQHLERSRRIGDVFPSLKVANNRLTFGPEPEGAITATRDYLERETSEEAKEAILGSAKYRYRLWLPLFMIGVLLLTWGFPLQLWSVTCTAISLVEGLRAAAGRAFQP
jgi:hypothetical protein